VDYRRKGPRRKRGGRGVGELGGSRSGEERGRIQREKGESVGGNTSIYSQSQKEMRDVINKQRGRRLF